MATAVLEFEVLYSRNQHGDRTFLICLPDPGGTATHRTATLTGTTAAVHSPRTRHAPHHRGAGGEACCCDRLSRSLEFTLPSLFQCHSEIKFHLYSMAALPYEKGF